jgi:hypothetical protein
VVCVYENFRIGYRLENNISLTLLEVINPCHLHDVRKMTQPDDTTKTLSKHGGSLCYKPYALTVALISTLDSYRPVD